MLTINVTGNLNSCENKLFYTKFLFILVILNTCIYYFSFIKLGILQAIKVSITNFLSEFNYLPFGNLIGPNVICRQR